MSRTEPTFEEALAGLERHAADLVKPGVTLEEAIGNFEKGMERYGECRRILDSAKQRVTTYKEGMEP